MRKIGLLLVLFGAACMMGGCIKDVPLTDREMDIVAEYAAHALLAQDPVYNSALIKEVTPTPEPALTPEPTKAPAPTENPGTDEKPEPTKQPGEETTPAPTEIPDNTEFTDDQITEVVGVEGFRVTYAGYETLESIQSGDYFSLNAKPGRQYLLVKFEVTNETERELAFDTTEQRLECTVDINLGSISRASLSMLPNDLQYMNAEAVMQPGETQETVLVFEISSKEEIQTAHVRMKNQNDEIVIIKLK